MPPATACTCARCGAPAEPGRHQARHHVTGARPVVLDYCGACAAVLPWFRAAAA